MQLKMSLKQKNKDKLIIFIQKTETLHSGKLNVWNKNNSEKNNNNQYTEEIFMQC